MIDSRTATRFLSGHVPSAVDRLEGVMARPRPANSPCHPKRPGEVRAGAPLRVSARQLQASVTQSLGPGGPVVVRRHAKIGRLNVAVIQITVALAARQVSFGARSVFRGLATFATRCMSCVPGT